MFAVTVTHPAWAGPRRFGFTGLVVTIGADKSCGLILADPEIAAAHLRFRIAPATSTMDVTAVSDDHALFVNDARVSQAPIASTDRVRITAYTLQFELVEILPLPQLPAYQPANEVEAGLLAALGDRDGVGRIVYADWLEQQGDVARADFLRLQHKLRARWRKKKPDVQIERQQLSALAAAVDPAWKLRVGQPPVEHCEVFRGQCTKDWSELAPTDQADVRHCGGCGEPVYYATSVAEARDHALAQRCVALDASSIRWPKDVAAPYCDKPARELSVRLGRIALQPRPR